MSLEYKGEPEGTIKIVKDKDILFVDGFTLRSLPKKRYKLITCKHIFTCYNISVKNISSLPININIGKSEIGSRSIDCEKGNFGVSIKPNQEHNFEIIKCFFDEELFIESTSLDVNVRLYRLNECPNQKIVNLSNSI